MGYSKKAIKNEPENSRGTHLNSQRTNMEAGTELKMKGSDDNPFLTGNIRHPNGNNHEPHTIRQESEIIAQDKTIHQLFEERVGKMPNRIALISGSTELTYAELNVKANQLAHYLIENFNIDPDEPIGIITERSERMIVAILAILKAGGAYLPIEPTNPIERIKIMIEDSKMKVLLSEGSVLKKIQDDHSSLQFIDIWDEKNFSDKTENPATNIEPGSLVYVIYTSGSTGNPKGVMVEHRNLVHYVNAYLDNFKLSSDDTYFQVSSASFDAFAEELFPALLTGAKVVLTKKSQVWDIQQLAYKINQYKASFITCTPALLSALNEVFVPERQLTFIAGGDILKREHISNLIGKSTIYNSYGPTEATICATYYHVTEPVVNPISIGKAILGYQIYILNKNDENVDDMEPGELCIAGQGLARGYLGNERLTKEKFTDNPVNPGERIYRTGDNCKFLPDGNIEFLGRIDNQVKIRGFRIELGEIEKTITLHPEIKDCLVTIIENDGNKELAAYIIPRNFKIDKTSEYSFGIDGLIDLLKTKLTDYMIPVYFVEMDRFPVTNNDKIDKSNLPFPSKKYAREEREIIAPATETETSVLGIWGNVLKIANISTNQNFFDLGGHSLMVFRIVNKINEVFKIQFPISAFFNHPTISEISKQIEYIKKTGLSLKYNSLVKIPLTKPLALSPGQESLWFINEFSGDSPLYNIPMSLRITGNLNVNKLSDSLNEILKRHQGLRTTFENIEGEPFQVINEFAYQPLLVEEISGISQKQIQSKLTEEARKTFDLSKPFLVRWKLFRISETENILFICFHHIITDGWSINLFFKELEHLYNENQQELPELAFHYPDYALWLNNLISSSSFNEQLTYWETKLGFNPKPFELPADKPRPALQTYTGNTIETNLGADLTEALKQFSNKNGKTLFMTLLAAFKALLFKLTNQDFISIGSPSANRSLVETENMMGYFVNSLVLKTDLSGDPTFLELLNRVQQTAYDAYAHQDVPFEKLASHLLTSRDSMRTVLFQIMFVLENATEDHPKLNGLEIVNQEIPTGTSKVDLSFIIEEMNNQANIKVEYNTDLYFEKNITQLLEQYKNLLAEIVIAPDFPISKLDIENKPNKISIINREAPSKSVIQLFEEQVEKTPNNVAVVCNEIQLTYWELNEKINRLAHYLRDNYQIKPDEPIGIYSYRSERMIVALLAIIKAGGAYLPIDPDNPIERIKFIIGDSKMKLLLSEGQMVNSVQAEVANLSILDIWDDKIYSDKTENPGIINSSNDLVYIIYTSGSTGSPKGVMIEHGNLITFLNAFQHEFNLSETDTYIQVTSVSFDVFNSELFPTIVSGAKIIITTKKQVVEVELLAKQINKHKATFLSCTPSLLSALNDTFIPGHKLTIIGGGDVLKREHYDNLIKSCSIYNGYGPTEATVFSTFYLVKESDTNPISIGKPLLGYEAFILDNNQLAPDGGSGELCLGGPGLARGYLRNEELTRAKFIDNPINPGQRIYKTGDLCRLQPDGNIEFIGRIDNQVKIRGYRIELGEIENRMLQYGGIKECVVTANKSTLNTVLVAYYIPENGKGKNENNDFAHSLKKDKIQDFLSTHLPSYMIPVYFVEMKKFPLNANGKIDRAKLPEPVELNLSEIIEGRDSISEKEYAILLIWKEVLNRKYINIDQNFFDLGGHSLLATKITYQINKYFGTHLLVSTIFEAQTIREFAKKVNNTETFNKTGAVIQLRPGTENPFFLFSGNDGNPFTFNKFANHYPSGQPLYFIQYPAGDEKTVPYKTMEEYIANLIKKFKEIQPNGPYNIVGYSLGGRFAFEAALQLQQSGEKIQSLTILSAVPPLFSSTKNPIINFILVESDVFLKMTFSLKLKYLRHRVSHLFERFFRKLSHSTKTGDFNNIHLFVDVTEETEKYLGMYKLWSNYTIKSKFIGNMLLVRESGFDNDLQYTSYYFDQVYPDFHWSKFVDGKITIKPVPFDHNLLLEEPYAQEIAKIINNYID